MNYDDNVRYRVLMNSEEQYCIWPEPNDIPAGWSQVGEVGEKVECLDRVKRLWTDMRPLSLRKAMEAEAGS